MLLNDVLIQKYIFIYDFTKREKNRYLFGYYEMSRYVSKKEKSWKERAQWSDLHEARAQRR